MSDKAQHKLVHWLTLAVAGASMLLGILGVVAHDDQDFTYLQSGDHWPAHVMHAAMLYLSVMINVVNYTITQLKSQSANSQD